MKNLAGRNISIPDGLVFYSKNGETWVYIPIKPQTYLRHPIQVEDIKGDSAVLNDGSHIGSNVVYPGGSALLGSELEN